jgi:hypothetical protein
MHVAANFPVGIVTHHQRKLGVGLEVGQAVEHLHAGVFQAARPVNVGGFFETSFQLHDDGDFLLPGRFQQRLCDGRIIVMSRDPSRILVGCGSG